MFVESRGYSFSNMTTSDGISAEDWDKVHELAVEVVKSGLPSDYRTRLLRYLDQLETKYGELPSILGIHVAVLHSQAAPRTPLASPWAGGQRRVSTRSEKTWTPQRRGTAS
jgi:hypothetical protein